MFACACSMEQLQYFNFKEFSKNRRKILKGRAFVWIRAHAVMLPAEFADLNPLTICDLHNHPGPSNHITSSQFSVAYPDPGSGAFLTPRSGMGNKARPGSGIRDEHPRSFFRELRKSFWVTNTYILWCGSRSGIFLTLDPGSGINIPYPQHCFHPT